MHLYHAGNVEIRRPDIFYGRKNADFGQGFYMTPDREFAYRWSHEGSVLNEYELDPDGLDVCRLSRDQQWSDYIFCNRRYEDRLDCDVIIGPVANDIIYDTFGIISSGFLNAEERLQLLLIGPEYIQVAVKSEKAAAKLRFLRSEKIQNAEQYRKLRKEEEKAYQELLAQEIQKLEG